MVQQHVCDVLVVGSGAGGFSAAITARHHGLDVLMVEKEPLFGGTTCYSAGVIWIPGSGQAKAAGIDDPPGEALKYLESIAGNRLDRDRATAFLEAGPEMLKFIEAHTDVRYVLVPSWADYEPELPGGSNGGRSLAPEPFDGRRLGARFDQLRPPLASMMLLGGMMVGRTDLPHLFNMLRVPKSAWHAARMFARYGRDRLRWNRGTRLANGNALIAGLALAAQEKGIPLWLKSPVVRLVVEGGRVTGAIVSKDGGEVHVMARRGVVLASGGFAGDTALKARLYGHVAAGREHQSLPPATNTGDGIRIAIGSGAGFQDDVHHAAAWTPVSFVPQPDGSRLPYPHFLDRGKPGYISVDRRGRRFVNEAKSYHVYVPAMIEACRGDARTECWKFAITRPSGAGGSAPAPPRPGRLKPYHRVRLHRNAATPRRISRTGSASIPRASRRRSEPTTRCAARRGPRVRARHRCLPAFQRGARTCAQSVRGAARPGALLRGAPGAGRYRHVCGPQDRWLGAGARHDRRRDRGALCGRERHGERHGRHLSGRRHHHRARR